MMPDENPHLARLRQLQEEFEMYPGAAPGGTGDTGLASNDAQGYSDLLNRRSEFANLEREMAGKGPMNVRYGGEYQNAPSPSTLFGPNLGNGMAQTSSVPVPPALQGLQQAAGRRRR